MSRAWIVIVLIVLMLAAVVGQDSPLADKKPGPQSPTPKQLEFFEARIRPVLVEHCYQCHNSAKSAKGGLKLDDRAGLLKGGDEGAIVVPGKPKESRLLNILRHEVPGMNMPKDGPKLDKKAIADFEEWIAMGAPDPRDKPPSKEELSNATSWSALLQKRRQWWSFQPIKNLPPPLIAGDNWSSNDIDRFIYATMKANQLEPASLAEPAVLIRRLYFALIGLPPTPDELQTWLERLKQPNGYEQLVEHLLASPHFGERWARHWMDWIRYADSHGSEGDPEIVGGWRYRDYLIRALNADVPYDQLVREHVAGDLLKEPRINKELGIVESAIGPAHWRMVFHGFAPTDALEEKVRFIDDQINTFSKAFLGLTVSCARCHDHKFDAISQRDYYALFGVLASCRPGRATIDVPEKLEKNRDRLAVLKDDIRKGISEEWLKVANVFKDWLLDAPLLGSDEFWKKADQPSFVMYPFKALYGKLPNTFERTWERELQAWEQDRKRRTEFQNHPILKRWDLSKEADYAQWFHQGTGLAAKPSPAGEFAVGLFGNQALTGIYPAGVYSHLVSSKHAARLSSNYISLKGHYDLWLRVNGDGASARYVVHDYPRDGTIYPRVKLGRGWFWQKFDLSYWNGDEIHVELATAQDAPLLVGMEARSWFGITEAVLVPHGEKGPSNETREHHDVLFELAQKLPPKSDEDLADRYVQVLTTAVKGWQAGTLSNAQAIFLDKCLEQDVLPNRLADFPKVRPLIDEYRRLHQEIDVPVRVPSLEETIARDQPLLSRGDHKKPMEVVPRRFLEAINPAPYQTAQSGRLQLAEDLLRDNNPFTRRVIVNRLWHHLLGRGIVPTPDNLGRLGQVPTHPELLDYLAARFVEQGWSIKETIRFIVLSKTWRLSSTPSKEAQTRDPENQFYSHAPLQRLEAEAIRDAVLAVSGSLQDTRYGSPVEGKAPRRSLYVRVQRTALDPFLRVFDFPEPFSATGRRDVTNVPAQSLALMNDPQMATLAANWVTGVLGDRRLAGDEARLQRMFLAAFSRQASEEEMKRCKDYLNCTKTSYWELAQQAEQIRQQIQSLQTEHRTLIEPVQRRLLEEANGQKPIQSRPTIEPIHRWVFKNDAKDETGTAHGEIKGDARIKDGALVLANQGYVIIAPIAKTIREKTLEAWVQLDQLTQTGGGVMSIQTPDGAVFDAIVFAELQPQRWMAGSNNYVRSQSFQGMREEQAHHQTVHLAIAYHSDGRIICYRNGVPYGKAYQTSAPIEYQAGQAVIGFGIRHLPAGGNRMLSGRIQRAHLYDRALSAAEIQASFQAAPHVISEEAILAALLPQDRTRVEHLKNRIKDMENQLSALGAVPTVIDDNVIWSDLARALFCMKEFIYIR